MGLIFIALDIGSNWYNIMLAKAFAEILEDNNIAENRSDQMLQHMIRQVVNKPLSLYEGEQYNKWQPPRLKNEVSKCQKLQFLEWPLETGSESESIPIHCQVKMPNFIAEITTWKMALVSIANFVNT